MSTITASHIIPGGS